MLRIEILVLITAFSPTAVSVDKECAFPMNLPTVGNIQINPRGGAQPLASLQLLTPYPLTHYQFWLRNHHIIHPIYTETPGFTSTVNFENRGGMNFTLFGPEEAVNVAALVVYLEIGCTTAKVKIYLKPSNGSGFPELSLGKIWDGLQPDTTIVVGEWLRFWFRVEGPNEEGWSVESRLAPVFIRYNATNLQTFPGHIYYDQRPFESEPLPTVWPRNQVETSRYEEHRGRIKQATERFYDMIAFNTVVLYSETGQRGITHVEFSYPANIHTQTQTRPKIVPSTCSMNEPYHTKAGSMIFQRVAGSPSCFLVRVEGNPIPSTNCQTERFEMIKLSEENATELQLMPETEIVTDTFAELQYKVPAVQGSVTVRYLFRVNFKIGSTWSKEEVLLTFVGVRLGDLLEQHMRLHSSHRLLSQDYLDTTIH